MPCLLKMWMAQVRMRRQSSKERRPSFLRNSLRTPTCSFPFWKRTSVLRGRLGGRGRSLYLRVFPGSFSSSMTMIITGTTSKSFKSERPRHPPVQQQSNSSSFGIQQQDSSLWKINNKVSSSKSKNKKAPWLHFPYLCKFDKSAVIFKSLLFDGCKLVGFGLLSVFTWANGRGNLPMWTVKMVCINYSIFISEMKMVNWMWKKKGNKEEEEVNEEELKKKGFNPEGLEVEEVAEDQILTNFDRDYDGFISPQPEEALQIVSAFKFFPNDDEHRHEAAYSKGGKTCNDKLQVNKIRSIGKEMIKIVGKKIISGDLNLTRISFPIKVMVPKTALENSTMSCCMNPYFMRKACENQDPVERFKYVITNSISAFYYITMFLKPLNPVIGETLQGYYADGTQIYCEQISHHPPISYFLCVGPQNSYRYYGCYNFSAHAGLNSMQLVNKGYKVYEFANGDKVNVTFNKEIYSGVFVGSLRSEAVDTITFHDKKYDLKAEITFGKMKKKPSDYFESVITQKGKVISTFDGTYCGYLNFDNIRYWDGRFLKSFKIVLEEKPLESDYKKRDDLNLLRQGKIEDAQKAKELTQELQRRDVKLREKLGPKQ